MSNSIESSADIRRYLDHESVHELLQYMQERLDIYPNREDFPILTVHVGDLLYSILDELNERGQIGVTEHYKKIGLDDPCVEVYGGVATRLVAGTRVRSSLGTSRSRAPHVSPSMSPVLGPVSVTEPSDLDSSNSKPNLVLDDIPKPTDKDIRIRVQSQEAFELCRTAVESFVHEHFLQCISHGDRQPMLMREHVRRFYFQKSVVVPGSFSLISIGNGVNNVDIEFVFNMARPYFDDAHSAVVPIPVSLLQAPYDEWFQAKIEYYSQAGNPDEMWDLYERRVLRIRNPETVTNGLSLFCHAITQKGFQPPLEDRRHVSLELCRSFFGEFQSLRRGGRDPLKWVKSFVLWHYPDALDAYSFLAQMCVELAGNLMKEEFVQVSDALIPFIGGCLTESVRAALALKDKRDTVLALTGLIQGTLFLDNWCTLSMSDIRSTIRHEEELKIEKKGGDGGESDGTATPNEYDEVRERLGELSPQVEGRVQGFKSITGASRIAKDYNRRKGSRRLSQEFDDTSVSSSMEDLEDDREEAVMRRSLSARPLPVHETIVEEDGEEGVTVGTEESVKGEEATDEEVSQDLEGMTMRSRSASSGPEGEFEDDGLLVVRSSSRMHFLLLPSPAEDDDDLAIERARVNLEHLRQDLYRYMNSLLTNPSIMYEGIVEVVLKQLTESLLSKSSDTICETLYSILSSAISNGHASAIKAWFDAVASKSSRDEMPVTLYSFLEESQCDGLMSMLKEKGLVVAQQQLSDTEEESAEKRREEKEGTPTSKPLLDSEELIAQPRQGGGEKKMPPRPSRSHSWKPSEPLRRRGGKKANASGGKGAKGGEPGSGSGRKSGELKHAKESSAEPIPPLILGPAEGGKEEGGTSYRSLKDSEPPSPSSAIVTVVEKPKSKGKKEGGDGASRSGGAADGKKKKENPEENYIVRVKSDAL
mmetsp:Transcript_33581/g.85984  ORF Transcript_33581/g.85984 Transcript_33581/m.85984 type:complete len:931 (-) Transcript_33581:56-2848(-)